ncbi:MAG: hypothetical protein KDA44_23635, partial [Planctomycetales bacterium]|nr:hypothetical protein [Planctomycetales bacterium]
MPASHPLNDADASWRQQEDALARLHDAARRATSPRVFYRLLLDEFAACFGDAARAAVWLASASGAVELLIDGAPPNHDSADLPTRRQRAANSLSVEQATADGVALCQPIRGSVDATQEHRGAAVIELTFAPAATAAMRETCGDFVAAAADAAADFHAFAQLRSLAAGANLHRLSGPLLRSLQRENQLMPLAYAAANEGRRLLDCERLTVLLRRGRRLRVLAVSGVDHVEARTEFSRRAESLAGRIADWGEPIAAGEPAAADELPPPLADALAEYLDQTHARTVAAAPIAFPRDERGDSHRRDDHRRDNDAVFLAEWFSAAGPAGAAVQVAELGELC